MPELWQLLLLLQNGALTVAVHLAAQLQLRLHCDCRQLLEQSCARCCLAEPLTPQLPTTTLDATHQHTQPQDTLLAELCNFSPLPRAQKHCRKSPKTVRTAASQLEKRTMFLVSLWAFSRDTLNKAPSTTVHQPSSISHAHLVREYLGVRVRFRVLGLWKTTEWRGFRDFFHVFFLTALAAWAALPLASLAVCIKQ